MPARPRRDPYANFNFLVEIDGSTVGGFTECSGLVAETAVIEYREGSDRAGVRKLPGLTRYSNVVLKRGVTTSRELFEWHRRIAEGELDRRTVVLSLLDESRNVVLRARLRDAWPCKWEGPVLHAKGNEVAIESLELTHEGLELDD